MTDKTTSALKLAEKTLRDIIRVYKFETGTPVTALAAIGEALEEQEKQEPVAEVRVRPLRGNESAPQVDVKWVTKPTTGFLYAAPVSAKREWVELTDDEIDESWCIEPKPINGLLVAEPVKQEPVAVISESAIGLVKLHSNGACLPFGTQLYAAPVDAKAIRAEALEEAAKVCDFENHQLTGMRMDNEAWAAKNCAAAIRGLK